MEKIRSDQFEKEGLKIDKNRVLTYSQLSCPLDCKYCFVEDMDSNQHKNVAYLSDKQLTLLKELPLEVNLIMLGCDTEFFQSREKSLRILNDLIPLKKDISVITKLSLPENFLNELSIINNKLKKQRNSLTLSFSIPCFESYKEWEPKVSPPAKRIQTLKSAYEKGLKTLVAIRPLLPTISNQELEQIVSETKDYCLGYYSGPFYLKKLDNSLLKREKIPNLKIEKLQPHWMPQSNIFYSIEKEGQSDALKNILRKYGKRLFEGAAEAIKAVE